MQSVEQNKNARTGNPLYPALSILAAGALLLAGGCRTKAPEPAAVEPPPTVIMPPAPAAQPTIVAPPVAPPDFKSPPPAAAPAVEPGLTYTVKSGDSLSYIAARYGVSAKEIAEMNGISNPNKVRIGQKLVLPAYAKERTVKKPATKKPVIKKSASAPAPKSAPAVGGDEYVVKSGDSLSKIAAHLHVKIKDLREVNGLQDDKLKIGQKLKIPGKSADASAAAVTTEAVPAPAPAVETPMPALTPDAIAPAPAPAVTPDAAAPAPAPAPAPVVSAQTFEITVDAGESLASIASRYGVLPDEIKKLNNITEVVAGQKLKLPLPTP